MWAMRTSSAKPSTAPPANRRCRTGIARELENLAAGGKPARLLMRRWVGA